MTRPIRHIGRIVAALRRDFRLGSAPVKRMPAKDPFRVIISAVLSTRTQDPVTAAAARRLRQAASDSAALARLKPADIEKLIYPVGFYRQKARLLPVLGRMLVENWSGDVPRTMDELLLLPGVGRKVANIVLAKGFSIPAIAVDTHVHRICNRLGLVRTKTPEQTERALERSLPKRYWLEWNELLVAHGQTICRPMRPKCPECSINAWCRKVGLYGRRSTAKNASSGRGARQGD